MSKFFKVLIVMLTVAAVAAPAVVLAEDRLSLSGYYTLRAFVKDGADYNDDASDSTQYYYQRLRMTSKIAVAEGVSAVMRADIAEGNSADGTTEAKGNIQFDQAYGMIDKDSFSLQFGQFGVGFGNAMLLDRTRDTNIVVAYKPANLTLGITKIEGTETAPAASSTGEQDLYTAQMSHKTDMYTGGIFLGLINTTGSDVQRMALGVTGDFDFVKFELNYIDGEDAAGADEAGLQLYVDAGMDVSDTVGVGGILTYAAAGDSTTTQVVDLISNDFSPENWGFMGTLYTVYGLTGADTFDPSGAGAGVIGVQPYVDAKFGDISTHAHIAYVMPEDDAMTNLDSIMTVAASARYPFAANTNFDVAGSYSVPEFDDATSDDPNTTLAMRMTVSF